MKIRLLELLFSPIWKQPPNKEEMSSAQGCISKSRGGRGKWPGKKRLGEKGRKIMRKKDVL